MPDKSAPLCTEKDIMASRPRPPGRPNAGRGIGGRGGERSRAAGSVNRVEEIVSLCPVSMGSGLFVDDTESGREGRRIAVAKIKDLLMQLKANIKVRRGLHCNPSLSSAFFLLHGNGYQRWGCCTAVDGTRYPQTSSCFVAQAIQQKYS